MTMRQLQALLMCALSILVLGCGGGSTPLTVTQVKSETASSRLKPTIQEIASSGVMGQSTAQPLALLSSEIQRSEPEKYKEIESLLEKLRTSSDAEAIKATASELLMKL